MADQFSIIADMVREAERHADDLSRDRLRALEYYRGVMTDTPSEANMSKMVSRVVRAQIKDVLPSISRTLLHADEVVEFQPVGNGDDDGAQQASDYINYVVMQECGAKDAIYDAIHDALLLRNGILKWWFEEKQAVKISRHTGLDDTALAVLIGGDDTEVLEHSQSGEITDQGILAVHDVKIRRTFTQRNIRAAAVPRERFLIHPDAVSLDDSLVTGEKTTIRRSDLVAMGYDRDQVFALGVADEDDGEEDARRDTVTQSDEAQRANEPVDYYDLYIRVDLDGDGISELRHMCFAGGLAAKNLLIDEECDEVQFCDVAVMRQPHQWEGISLADDLMDIQQAETALMRQTLDNIYWQNMPQPIIQAGAIEDLDAVYNPGFGKPIRAKMGVDARSAITFNQVPFVARESFGMLEYLDREARNRTGVNDASAGLAPDALQNMTATASAMIEQAGIGQTEMMVRTIADGLKRFFRGLLKLSIRHQDRPRTIRLRDQWVEVDPRHWNADMDCSVNTGLGAGTRERDMAMMQIVMGAQEKLLTAFGPDNPYVKPDQLYNALAKMVESAGLKTPGLYFSEPDPQEVQAKLQADAQQPSPEMMKVQAQAQAEQAKLQMQAQNEQQKLQAQLQADAAKMQADVAIKREQMAAEMQLRREQMLAEMQLKREQMQLEAAMRAAMPQTPHPSVGSDVQFGGEVG